MLKLIKWLLFGGCQHKWQESDRTVLRRVDDDGKTTGVGTRIILRCEKCGDFEQRDLI